MRVFRPTRVEKKTGKSVPYKRWYVEYRDHLGIVHRMPVFSDRKQTGTFGQKLDKLIVCRSNGEPPDKELRDWLAVVPGRILDKLAQIGLLGPEQVASAKPLHQHNDDCE